MTQKDRELLLRDLCARLSYKPKIQWDGADYDLLALENCEPIFARIMDDRPYSIAMDKPLEEIKPYLRPMSSMTEEEKKELLKFGAVNRLSTGEVVDVSCVGFDRHCDVQDWLNKHHFDYRGLIEKGLAIEATEGMYNETNTEEI